MSERTITKEEHYQLIGLLALAKQKNRELDDICNAAMAITGDHGQHRSGHTEDAVYSDFDVDELLRQLGITVEELT